MLSELGAVRDHGQARDPRLAPAGPAPHWDAHKWNNAPLRETVLSLAAGVHFRGLVGEP